MPRTKLDVMTPERQREIVNKVIRHAMVEKGINTPEELACRVSMSGSTVRRRFKDGGWTIEELQRIADKLSLSAADAGKMLGIKTVA